MPHFSSIFLYPFFSNLNFYKKFGFINYSIYYSKFSTPIRRKEKKDERLSGKGNLFELLISE